MKHRSQLKNRIHSALISFGRPCPVSDLFGIAGRGLLARLDLPQPWRGNIEASLLLIDQLESQVAEVDAKLRASGADHPYLPLLLTVPGVGCARLHDRGGDRRGLPLPHPDQAHRLHRPLPAGGAVG